MLKGLTTFWLVTAETSREQPMTMLSLSSTAPRNEIGTENPDESDGVADKYQVTFLFKAEGKGVLAQGTPTKLVKTLMDDNGEYLQSEKASIVADDSVKAEPYTGYEIDEWTSEEFDGLSWTSNPLTTAALSVTGGKTYTFTATFKSQDFNVVLPLLEKTKKGHKMAAAISYP